MKTSVRLRWIVAAVVISTWALWSAWRHRLPESAVDYKRFIATLHPIRVYEDRFNIVVVQQKSGDFESGKYIMPVESSYMPDGEKGDFDLGALTDAIEGDRPGTAAFVFDYEKGRPPGTARSPFHLEWTNPTPSAVASPR